MGIFQFWQFFFTQKAVWAVNIYAKYIFPRTNILFGTIYNQRARYQYCNQDGITVLNTAAHSKLCAADLSTVEYQNKAHSLCSIHQEQAQAKTYFLQKVRYYCLFFSIVALGIFLFCIKFHVERNQHGIHICSQQIYSQFYCIEQDIYSTKTYSEHTKIVYVVHTYSACSIFFYCTNIHIFSSQELS